VYLKIAQEIRRLLLMGLEAPRRLVLSIPGGSFLAMPAADDRFALCKLVTVEPGKTPSVFAELWVKDLATGEVHHLEAEDLTAKRTAALSLLAAQTLAPVKEGALLLVGAGRQAEAHLEAFREGLALTRVWVRGRGQKRALRLLEKARALGLEAALWEEEEVPPEVRFVVTATTSPTPVLPEALPTPLFISAVGSFRPGEREVPEGVMRRAAVFCDTPDALQEAGELQGLEGVTPLREALLRPPRAELVVFKSVGHALFDLAAVRAYLSQA
jgi:ornithine cyclodeaminase